MQLPVIAAGPSGDRRVYRSVGTMRAAVLSTAGMVGIIVFAFVRSRGDELLVSVVTMLSILWTWRSWTLGVYTDDRGITVRGVVRSKRIAWTDIDHFAVMPAGNYRFVGHVVPRDGRHPRPILSIAAANWPNPDKKQLQAQGPVDELNLALARWREATGQEQGPQDALQPALRREQATADYRTARAVLLGFGGAFWAISIAIVAIEPRPAVFAFAAALALLNTAWVILAMRNARKKHLNPPVAPPGPTAS